MSDDEKSVEIARLSYRQGIIVAFIAASAGVLTTLISSDALRRRHEDIPAASLASMVSTTTGRPRIFDSKPHGDDGINAEGGRAADPETVDRSGPAYLTPDRVQRLLTNLNDELAASKRKEAQLQAELATVTEERAALRVKVTAPPEMVVWYRRPFMSQGTCVSNAMDAMGRAGVNNVVKAGDDGLAGEVESARIGFQCGDVEMIVVASADHYVATAWRDKLRDEFLRATK